MIDRDKLREALAFYGDPDSYVGHEQSVLEAARLVADPDTLTITKVDGEWHRRDVATIEPFMGGESLAEALEYAVKALDALLEGQPK